MKDNELHVFSNGDVHVAYNPEDMRFYRLADETWAAARKGTLPAPPEKQEEKRQQAASAKVPAPRSLERLVLIVTTHCNLRCRYCYADGGDYGMGFQHMSPALARQALDWTYGLVQAIGAIQFFGGEPTLNPESVETVCETLQQRHTDGEIDRLPQYALVTNGTLLPSKMERLIKEYRIHLTYSVDGPTEVHDLNRRDVNGDGSLARALRHFHQLGDAGDVSQGVEMTYSPQALQAGYGIWELAQFSQSELGLFEPHIVPVQSEPDSVFAWNGTQEKAIASYRDATTKALHSLLESRYTGFSFVSTVLRTLITHQARSLICPAGAGTLAVDPEGDVYPCFMFAGQPEFRLGNVKEPLEEDVFMERLQGFVHHNHKESHTNCRTCWARKLCTGCIGEIHVRTGRLDRESDLTCGIMKAVAEETMLFLAEIQEEPAAWQRFVKHYRDYRIDQFNPVKDVI